jgi:acetyl esterase/lipase
MPTNQEFFQAAGLLFQRYYKGDYAGALKAAGELAARFPEEAVHTYLWRICLTSRLKQSEEALRLFAEGLEAGYWWAERQLRQDPDLELLQGLPEFERMVATSHTRHMAAQVTTQPELQVYAPPSTVSSPYPLFIALHGRGRSSEDDEASSWKHACGLGWLVAMPRSSQLVWPGAYGWDDDELAGKEIAAHYERLCSQYPVDRSRVVLGGISQGGALAVHLALGRKLPVRGFLAVVPGNSVTEGLEALVQSVQGGGCEAT